MYSCLLLHKNYEWRAPNNDQCFTFPLKRLHFSAQTLQITVNCSCQAGQKAGMHTRGVKSRFHCASATAYISVVSWRAALQAPLFIYANSTGFWCSSIMAKIIIKPTRSQWAESNSLGFYGGRKQQHFVFWKQLL